MRRHHSTRLVVALTVPALAAAILIPGAAAFAGSKPKPVKGSCTSMSGNINGTVNIAGCMPSPNATPTGTFSGFGSGQTSGGAVLTWTNGNVTHFTFKSKGVGQTATKKGASIPNPKYHCPRYGDGSGIQAAIKGKITTQTLATGTGLKGAIKGTVCVDLGTGAITLLGGTVFAL